MSNRKTRGVKVDTTEAKARKRGRPTASEPRVARIYVSFTEKEYELLEERSRAESLPVAVYIRSKAINTGANN